MKLLCFIDSLGSGGAQRQLVMLAIGLKKRGHQIRFLVYRKDDHFLPFLQSADIPCQVIPPCSYFQRSLNVRKILRADWHDAVLAFQEAPSLYAGLACIPGKQWGLIMGERSANPKMQNLTGMLLRQFHRLADAVVCNSYTNQLMLEVEFPYLKKKLSTVYNTVDLNLFIPSCQVNTKKLTNTKSFRIVVVARYDANKNMMNLAKALLVLKLKRSNPSVVVDWFGAVPSDSTHYRLVEKFVDENDLKSLFRLHHATRDVVHEFSQADAVGLFSFFEGLPNVVCEGMACGKPILLSKVCDADNLVQDGKNGFLCNPSSPEDIAEKILCLASMSEKERRDMGLESRLSAERLFADDIVIDRYERILLSAANHDVLPADCNWPLKVPQSAVKTVEQWVIKA